MSKRKSAEKEHAVVDPGPWKNLPREWTPDSPLDFGPEAAVVSVMVNEKTNDLTVLPTSVHVAKRQQIWWVVWVQKEPKAKPVQAPGASVLLSFRDARAVGTSEVRSDRETAAAAKATDAVGRYHYKVMVSTGGKIYADVGCPSMTIKN